MRSQNLTIRQGSFADAPRLHELHTISVRTQCSDHYAPEVIDGRLTDRTPHGYLAPIGTATAEPALAQPPAPNPEDTFDPAQLIEDFEHPICQFCMGTGMVRDENGINIVTCDYWGRDRAYWVTADTSFQPS